MLVASCLRVVEAALATAAAEFCGTLEIVVGVF